MLITTCDVIPGKQVEVLGLVRGNVVTSKHIGRDIMAGPKDIAGGRSALEPPPAGSRASSPDKNSSIAS